MLKELQRTQRFFAQHPVAQHRLTATWRRWFLWQLRSRLTPGPHEVAWIGSTKLIVESRMTGATGNVYCGLHEFADMALVVHFLSGQENSSKAMFVDVGANVGSYTILAAGVAGASAVCIEPSPSTFDRLTRNVHANGLDDRVMLVQAAVGDKAGEIRFSMDRDCENQVVDETYQGTSALVPLMTIDKILDGCSPTMVKMDVEGFEEQAIAGATQMLNDPNLQAILLEGVSQNCESSLTSAGFVRRDYNPMSRQIIEDSPQRHLGNELWLRDGQYVEATCKKAEPLSVFGLEI